MADMLLATTSDSVTVYEAQDHLPQARGRLEPLAGSLGEVVVYEVEPVLDTLRVIGRLLTLGEATQIILWRDSQEEITVTDLAGQESMGWRVSYEAPPTLRRKDGESADWTLDMTLWRIHA